MAANETLDIDVLVNADKAKTGAGKAVDAIESIEKSADKGVSSIQHLNKGFGEMQALGGKMSLMVTAPLVALGTVAVKSAMDFGTGMAQMSTQFGNVNVNTKNLESTIKGMSKEFGIGADVIQNGYYEALSSGIPVSEDMAEATAFMTNNAKLAKAGFTTLDTAVDATTSILNAYGLSADKVNDISNILIKTQDYGKTTVDELGKTIAQVTPEAAALGVGFDQVGAAISTMTAQGINTPETMTKLKRLFIELRDTTTGAGEAFNKISGQSFKDFVAGGGDVQTAMQMMSDYAVANGLELGNMFSSAEAGSAALVLTSQNGAALFKESYADMQGGVDTLSSSFDKMNSTDQANLQRTLETLKVAMIDLGISLLPTVEKIVDGIENMVNGWINLSPGVQDAIINFGLFAVAAGPIIGVVGTIGSAVTGLAGMFGTAGAAATGVAGATGAAGVATAGLGGALGAAALAALPWVAGAVVVAGGAWLINEAVQSTVPEIDYFASGTANALNTTTTSFTSAGASAKQMSGEVNSATESTKGGLYGLGMSAQQVSTEYGAAYSDMITSTKLMDTATGEMSETMTVTISDATKEAIGSYMEMSEEIGKTYHTMWATNEKMTVEKSASIAATEEKMKNQILKGYDDKKSKIITDTQKLFETTASITEEEKAAILKTTGEKLEQQKVNTQNTFEEIKAIRERAANEARAITTEEQNRITELIKTGNGEATRSLSANAVEREIILTNFKNSSTAVTEQMVSEAVSALNGQRDATVAIANDEYSQKMRAIIQLRDEAGSISAEQADVMIQEAERQKDGIIKEADGIRQGGLDKLKESHGDLAKNIDADTGKIKDGWGRMFSSWDGWNPGDKKTTHTHVTKYETEGTPPPGTPAQSPAQTYTGRGMGYATGTTYAPGGWSAINERGFEMVDLPTGAKVLPHAATKHMLERQAKEMAKSNGNGVGDVSVNAQFEVTGDMQKFLKIIRREL